MKSSVLFAVSSCLVTFALSFQVMAEGVGDSTASVLRSFDGQVVQCEAAMDMGRLGYRVSNEKSVIRSGVLEVSLRLETLKCVGRGGRYAFEPAILSGKLVNQRSGFIEFQSLEFMVYTPDLKVIRSVALDQKQSVYNLTFSAPAQDLVGFLPRNVFGNSDRRAVFMGLLRGQAQLGDAITGVVQHRMFVSFGANPIVLSQAAGTVRPPEMPATVVHRVTLNGTLNSAGK